MVQKTLSAAFLSLCAAVAHANSIASIAVSDEKIFFSDYVRNRIWSLDAEGQLSVALPRIHTHHLVADQQGSLWGEHVTPDGGTVSLWKLEPGKGIRQVLPPVKRGETEGYEGTVFTVDANGEVLFLRECQIIRLSPGGKATVWAGKKCGERGWKEEALRYGHLCGSLVWGPRGELYFSDARTIRRIAPDGSVRTLDGRPAELFGAPAPGELTFERVMGVAVDAAGALYAADRKTRSVRKIAANGRAKTFARLGPLWTPTGLATAESSVYVLVEPRHLPAASGAVIGSPRLLRISRDGKVKTLAVARNR